METMLTDKSIIQKFCSLTDNRPLMLMKQRHLLSKRFLKSIYNKVTFNTSSDLHCKKQNSNRKYDYRFGDSYNRVVYILKIGRSNESKSMNAR